VLTAGRAALLRVVGPDIVACLGLVRAIHQHVLRMDLTRGPVLSTPEALRNYLIGTLAHQPAEHFRVLFLNARNELLQDELMSVGSTTGAAVYPREVLKRALELGATALIVAHNHPSGDPHPSRSDIAATLRLAHAASLFDIAMHDHFIVGASGCNSMRELGYLQ